MHPVIVFDEVRIGHAFFLLDHNSHLHDFPEARGVGVARVKHHVANCTNAPIQMAAKTQIIGFSGKDKSKSVRKT